MKNLIWLVVFVCGLVTYPCLSFSEDIAFQDGVYSACCFDDNNKTILAERVSSVEGSGEYYRVRIDNADNVSALSLEAQREVSFKIINQGNPLANADVNIYSDVSTWPEAYGTTDSNGILYDWGGSCLFTVDDGSYTVFVVSAADRTAILKTIDVSSSGEILIDITNEWAATTTLTVNARKLDSADPLSGSLWISISKAWPGSIGQLSSGNIEIHVTPHTYYYLGLWSWSDGYYLYESDLNVPQEGHRLDFYPTSGDSSTISVNVDNFDDTWFVPWLEDPDVWTAPCLPQTDIIMTPGIYTIWMDLKKYEWSFMVRLMENYTLLPASIVVANAGGDFSIETFETGSLAYKPGDRVDFSIRLNDQYGNRLWWSYYNGQSNYPSLIIRDPGNNVVYDGPTESFYSYYYTLAVTAIQGNYTATLTFDTGPHQGEISQIISFQVGLNLVCKGDFDGDGDVDGSDLAVFAADFGRTDCGTGDPCEGDFDDDGDVDGSDLAVFAADFGRTDCPINP